MKKNETNPSANRKNLVNLRAKYFSGYMKRLSLFTLLLLIGFCLPLQAQIRWNQRWQDYIDRYKDIAIVEMHKYGIPASITLAQGLLESGAGTSELATKGNNHFGIKSHGWGGRTMRHDDDRRGELFRVYDSPLESYEDHSKFLANRAHYKSLFTLDKTDYKGWAHGLKRAGYATNPKYAYRLIDIIEAYRLYEHDKASPIVRHDSNRDLAVTQGTPINKPDFSQVNVHRILKYNDNFYVVAREGDTYASIGKEMDIRARHLAKFNDREVKAKLKAGEVVWLSKKQKRAPKSRYKKQPYYQVKDGTSFYQVSQMFGIQLKRLKRMNPQLASRDYKVRVGDRVRIY